jgi:hypothetical protein
MPDKALRLMVRVSTRCRLKNAAPSYQQPLRSLRMVSPRAESSPSNCATPGEVSRSPGTMTAHSRFSRNSFDLICHCPKDDDFASPIWTSDQCRTSASAAASSGNGPDSMKWLFPCTRIPTIRSQASRRRSLHRSTHRRRSSPTLEPGLCGCAFLCQSGRRLPNAPRGPGNLSFRVPLVQRVAGRIQRATPESLDYVCPASYPHSVLRATFSTDRLSASFRSERPSVFAPITRPIPAASSGLRRPASAASCASRRKAAKRALMVDGARFFCSRKNRYRRTTVRLTFLLAPSRNYDISVHPRYNSEG